MSRAVLYDRLGGPETLHLADLADPPPEQDEVAVEVRAAGINPFDRKVREGIVPLPEAPFPRRLGSDLAGIVTATGSGARYGGGQPVAVGDEVLGWGDGALAERVLVPARQLTPRPPDLPVEVAGGLMTAGLTALASLRTLEVGAGDTVLLGGAAGAVGIVYAQLALRRGARVLGTASERHHAFLRSIGVEPVRYGEGLLERVRDVADGAVSAVQDNHGREALDVGVALGVEPARMCGIADHAAVAELGARSPGRFERSAVDLADLAADVAAGRLELPVAAVFALDEVVAAFQALESPHAPGKIVVTNLHAPR